VFESGEQDASVLAAAPRRKMIGNLDNRRYRLAYLAEKLEADGTYMLRHAVQNPARGDDQAVRALFLDTGQTGQKLVGDILAETRLAKAGARNLQHFGLAIERLPIFAKTPDLEAHRLLFVDLAEVVPDARHFHQMTTGVDQLPPGQIVDRRSPQHRLLAASVHRHVAADARGVCRSRIDGEHPAGSRRCFRNAGSDHTGTGTDGCVRAIASGQAHFLDSTDVHQLLGVDHCRQRRQRNRAAGVTGTATARNDGQPEFDAGTHQSADLFLTVRVEHHEGVFDAPVGGIGDVRDARQAVEGNIVAARMPGQGFSDLAAQRGRSVEMVLESVNRRRRGDDQLLHAFIALATLLDLAQTMAKRSDERHSPLATGEQIVLQVGIALHHPDIPEHLIEHPRRATGDAFGAQLVEQGPLFRAEQTNDNLAVGKRGVVVGDLAQACVH